ncbi:MAG: hypothetical protein JNM59_11495 [Hyphomonadaceae bacterium]|nr:hypothetical protein [Hyphomonadaceae bacterium]
MLTLNPGFVLIIASFLILAAPRFARPWLIAAAAIVAFTVLLGREFGAATAVAQMGLPVVFLSLDALNRIFGIAVLITLMTLAPYSAARRHGVEDAAILLLAGGALSALFVGDLVSFVAAFTLAGLASAWVVLASPLEGSNPAGARLLIWQGIEGLLLLVGVAFHLVSNQDLALTRLNAGTISGAFILSALLIRTGAPLAHVWFKDAVAYASPLGAAASAAFTTLIGVYALARMFPSEPALTWIGGAMIVLGAVYAVAEPNLRRAAAYAQTAQTGVCVALIGVGSPIALAGAEGHAFAVMIAFAALQMLLGGVVRQRGDARMEQIDGLAGDMPLTAVLLVVSGLAVSAAPGTSLFATQTVALDAFGHWDWTPLWALTMALPAVIFAKFVLRIAVAAYRPRIALAARNEAPFVMSLGISLALFFCITVGLAPTWLYDLMPADLSFDPFAVHNVASQAQLLGVGGCVYLLLHVSAARLTAASPARLLDADAFYSGPLAKVAGRLGRWGLTVYDTVQSAMEGLAKGAGRLGLRWIAYWDRPFSQVWGTLAQPAALALLLVIAFLASA